LNQNKNKLYPFLHELLLFYEQASSQSVWWRPSSLCNYVVLAHLMGQVQANFTRRDWEDVRWVHTAQRLARGLQSAERWGALQEECGSYNWNVCVQLPNSGSSEPHVATLTWKIAPQEERIDWVDW